MPEQILLSAVVPMTNMSGRPANFKSWIKTCEIYSVEVIIVIEGSEDATLDEVEKILRACNLPNHKIISGEFGSAGKARNAELNEVSGKWIAFQDSDDLVIVDEFVRMVTLADNRELDTVIGKFEIVSELDGKNLELLGRESQNLEVLARMPGLWRMAFRRNLIHETKFRSFRVAEDHHFLVDIDLESTRYEWYNWIVNKYFPSGRGHVTVDSQSLKDLFLATVRARLGPHFGRV
jgi:glycosyltransferase involved in cell wall biosynthesis